MSQLNAISAPDSPQPDEPACYATTGSGALFQVRGLQVVLGPSSRTEPVYLVERVDLDLSAGQLVGVVGETGAGKSVTMRALLGLLPSGVRAMGEMRIADRAFDLSNPTEVRSQLGRTTSVVLQDPVGMLDPLVRVGKQLVEGVTRVLGVPRDEARERALLLLSRMGFRDPEHVMKLFPHQLSGGMAQRVATAMGLMPRPQVLVLDEPTSALDANVRVEVMRLFQNTVKEERTGAFVVSHDLSLLSHFCDRIVVLYSGRVVEAGLTDDVLGRPMHPYTQALLASTVGLETPAKEILPIIAGQPPRPDARPPGCVFAPRCKHHVPVCDEGRPPLRGADHVSACIRMTEAETLR